jgi:hypothetical protein
MAAAAFSEYPADPGHLFRGASAAKPRELQLPPDALETLNTLMD